MRAARAASGAGYSFPQYRPGFSLRASILDNDAYEVGHCAFEFYGFAIYHVLINPHNPLAMFLEVASKFGMSHVAVS